MYCSNIVVAGMIINLLIKKFIMKDLVKDENESNCNME